MTKRHALTAAGFIISLILLYFSLRGIRFQEIADTLRRADFSLMAFPLFFIFLAVTLCAVRWARLTGGGARFTDTFVALLIGLFVNNVLPARLGEVARGYVLARRRKLTLTYALSTVFLDRFFDLTGLLIITFIFFPKHALPPKVSQAIYALIGLLVACIIVMIVLSRERFIIKLTGRLSALKKPFFSRLAHRVTEVHENLRRINSPFNVLYVVALSTATWLSMSVALYFITLIVGVSINFYYIPFVCALLNMGLAIPSSPGYVGVYQFLLVYLLSIFDVPKYEGFTVSILFHASWYIPYNIVGFLFVIKEHLRFKEIQELKEEDE